MKKRPLFKLLLHKRNFLQFVFVSLILLSAFNSTAQNLLTNGNFESGNGVGFQSDYTSPAVAGITTGRNYAIATNPAPINTANFSVCSNGDHTSGSGNMMVVDGSGNGAADKVWQALPAGGIPVTVGATYVFSYWIESISNTDAPGNLAVLSLTGNGLSVPVVTGGSATAPATDCNWQQVIFTFTATNAFLQIWLVDQTNSLGGNDFALDDLSLTVLPAPLAINYTVVNPSCPTSNNGSITVSGTGGFTPYTYSLNGGAFNATPDPFTGLGPSTNNYVSIKDAVGTIVNTAHNINLVSIGTATIPVTGFSYTTPVCANGTNPVPAPVAGFTAGGTYSAAPGGLTINAATGVVTLSSSTPNTYTVTYAVAASGCNPAGNSTANLVIDALPTATIIGTATICSNTGTNIIFNGTPNATVTYTINGGANQTIVLNGAGTATLPTGNLTATSTYALVSVTNAGAPGCSQPVAGSAVVTVDALPNATIAGTATICSNTATNITFNGTLNATVTYTINGGANQTIVLNGAGAATLPTGNLTATTTYALVSVVNAGAPGCNQPVAGSAVVTVDALPTATISGTATICSNTATNITFSGTPNATVTYTINGGANQTIVLNGAGTATLPTGNLTATTTYALVSVINAGVPACAQPAAGNAVVTVVALPTSTISGTATICSNTATNIIFNGTPDATVTYTVNGGANQTIVLNGAGAATLPTGNLAATATYALVSVTNAGTPACAQPQAGNAIVAVNPLPVATIAGSATIASGTGTNITFNGTPNGTVTYTVNGGANQTIVLDGAGNGTLPTGNLIANTTYALVSVTSGGVPSCSQPQSGSAVITVVTGPTATISGTATICANTATNITFNGTSNATVTYTVNGGANQTIVLNGAGTATLPTGNLTATATYTLVSVSVSIPVPATNILSGSAVVTVVALPTATISGTATICSNTATNITFNGTLNATVTYTINGGANQTIVLNGAGTATLPTGNLTATTTYALVSVVNAGAPGCNQPVAGSAVVTVDALPTATISGTATICSNTATNITFSGTPNATVTYTINGGANQTIVLNGAGTATLPTGNLIATTTYTLVSVVNAGAPGCNQPAAGSAVVTVNALPTSTISGTATICSNTATNIIFNGTPDATVTYTVNGGANQTIVLNGAGAATLPTGNLAATATYALVSVTNAGTPACAQPQAGNAIVAVNPLPVATIAGSATIASGTGTNITFNGTPNGTVTYTVNGGANQTIVLDGAGNGTLPTGNLIANTTYALVSVTSGGVPSCSQPQSGSAVITVVTGPTATISGTATICANTATNITFNGTSNATVTYTVNGGANQTIVLNGAGTATLPTGNLTATATYTLVSVSVSIPVPATNILSGSAVVTVVALPTATISGTATICSNTATNITFNGTLNATVTYTINGGANQTIVLNGAGTAILPTGNLTATTTYALVSVVNAGAPGCNQPVAGSAVVTVDALPTATISGTTGICSNTGTNITFNGTPDATVTYTVNSGANQTIVLNGAGAAILPTGNLTNTTNYALLSVADAGTSCSQQQIGSAMVTVHAPPVVSVAQSQITIDAGYTAVLTGSVIPSPGDGATYSWTPNYNIDNTDTLYPLVNPLVDTTYILTGYSTTYAGCFASASIHVTVVEPISIPNVFSPNGDGMHDTWYIKNIELYPNAEVSVFNRWGEFLFQSQGNYLEAPWDGTSNGKPVPIGTYYYIIKLNSGLNGDSKPLSGWVAVVR